MRAAAIDNRFQLKCVRSTGVLPRGAQVRRTDGLIEMPDSSSKTIKAFLRLAFFLQRANAPGPRSRSLRHHALSRGVAAAVGSSRAVP